MHWISVGNLFVYFFLEYFIFFLEMFFKKTIKNVSTSLKHLSFNMKRCISSPFIAVDGHRVINEIEVTILV